MSLIGSVVDAAARGLGLPSPRASTPATPISIDDYAAMLQFGMGGFNLQTTLRQDREEIGADFVGLVNGAFKANAVVFGCEMRRLSLFSQVRFQFQRFENGRPTSLFGSPDLAILEHPEPSRTTSELVTRCFVHADFAGNAFVTKRGPDRLKMMRPDWTTIIMGSQSEDPDPNPLDVEVIGYAFRPRGMFSDAKPVFLLEEEVAHFAPIPDPEASYRGMSWLTPIIREIQADSAATLHKLKFFENGATPNMVVTLDPKLKIDDAKDWIALFEQDHKGVLNAYKTIYFGGGAAGEVVGANLRQMDFKATQGGGETRIAMAAGIHPVIAALSEGLQGSSLNSGNFQAAAQLVADITLRPGWGELAAALERIVPAPAGCRLWYDERDVPFLKDDIKDAAEVIARDAQSIRTLTDGGYKPASVVSGVSKRDLSGLQHAGYLPVQVQPVRNGQTVDDSDEDASAVPLLAAGYVKAPWATEPAPEFRCPGTRANGHPCRNLLAESGPPGTRVTCDRCKTTSIVDETGAAVPAVEVAA